MKIDKQDVKNNARGRWRSIIGALSDVNIDTAMDKPLLHHPCPKHKGSVDGFRVFNDFDETGGTICGTCGSNPDGLSTLMFLNGWEFHEVLLAVHEYLTSSTVKPIPVRATPQPVTKDDQENNARLRAKLNALWQQGLPLDAPEAEPFRLYVATRGLDPLWAVTNLRNVRFIKELPYYAGKQLVGRFPGFVSKLVDVAGTPVTLHRTYLTPNGKKAPVDKPKKLMSYPSDRKASGGAIHLFDLDGPDLNVCEGLETAWAIAQTTGLPTWPTYSADMLAAFVPPTGVKRVWIWADQDKKKAGAKKARKLLTRLWEKGIRASILLPPALMLKDRKTVDWLDVLVERGPEELLALAHERADKATHHA